MSRLLTYAAIGSLALLIATSMFRFGNGIDLFMTSSLAEDIARMLLVAALIATLFVENRPRTRLFPGMFATIAALVIVYAVSGVVEYSLQVFDVIAYLLAAVTLMAEALSRESRVEPMSASRLTI